MLMFGDSNTSIEHGKKKNQGSFPATLVESAFVQAGQPHCRRFVRILGLVLAAIAESH